MRYRVSGGIGVCIVMLACEPGGVGDPCVPDDEYRAQFSGFALSEVNVESRSFSCETRVCLVNHFQGRVSCPAGQADGGGANAQCRIPGSDEPVAGAVEAWDLDRPPSHAVYCSCRCDGPDPLARYCECPSGFVCSEIVPELGLGREQLEGSYCIKRGSQFDPREVGGPTCQTDPEASVCSASPSE